MSNQKELFSDIYDEKMNILAQGIIDQIIEMSLIELNYNAYEIDELFRHIIFKMKFCISAGMVKNGEV